MARTNRLSSLPADSFPPRAFPAAGHTLPTRRQFLRYGATAAVGLGASAHLALGMDGMARTVRRIPNTIAARRTSANAWLPDAPSADQFRALALVAMDAAKQAGADFADIRIGVQRECSGGSAQLSLGYGIRARVNGTWSFEHGTVLTNDAVATLARSAVIGARTASTINAQLGKRVVEPFAAVPVVTGEWHSPVEIDPFTVPADDFMRVTGNFNEPARRYGFSQASGYLRWIAETRVFASTEGSLVTQSTMRGGPHISVTTWMPSVERVEFDVLRPDGESAGFEVMLRTNYYDRIIEKLEEAIRWCELPLKPFNDVGRYPAVFDGIAFAGIVGNTLNFALDADRLSGNEADASGRSFLQPFSEHPTQPPPEFASVLTITSNRAIPSSTAVQWDDDGVAPTPVTLVDQGTVTDFHTTRETAPLFETWYKRHNRPYQLHGRCVAPTPASLPMANGGDVVVTPSASAMHEAELYHDMSHGFLVKGAYVQAAPGLTTGLIGSPLIVEIRDGKPVARLFNLQMAFLTNAVLKTGLTALGDASTIGTTMARAQKGMPWQQMEHPVTAPAAHCKEVDILRTDLSR